MTQEKKQPPPEEDSKSSSEKVHVFTEDDIEILDPDGVEYQARSDFEEQKRQLFEHSSRMAALISIPVGLKVAKFLWLVFAIIGTFIGVINTGTPKGMAFGFIAGGLTAFTVCAGVPYSYFTALQLSQSQLMRFFSPAVRRLFVGIMAFLGTIAAILLPGYLFAQLY